MPDEKKELNGEELGEVSGGAIFDWSEKPTNCADSDETLDLQDGYETNRKHKPHRFHDDPSKMMVPDYPVVPIVDQGFGSGII